MKPGVRARGLVILVGSLMMCSITHAANPGVKVKVTRLEQNPIIAPASSASIGTNINGPSVIRVPDWVASPAGKYYLYFAHHKGKYIRMAFADRIEGPWTIFEPGVLDLRHSHFPTQIDENVIDDVLRERLRALGRPPEDFLYPHIASPEAIVVPGKQQIRLYYHGMLSDGTQATRVAVSHDGLHFDAREEIIARPYLRIFHWGDMFYGMAMPGVFYRSANGIDNFEEGPTLFNPNMRHAALMVMEDVLYVFWTRVGDSPERILLSTIDLTPEWRNWKATDPVDVLRPEREWEGAKLPLQPSVRGAIEAPANQLRDPALLRENGALWLFYAIAGESGIGVGRLELD